MMAIVASLFLLIGLLSWLHKKNYGPDWAQSLGRNLFSSYRRKVIVWETITILLLLVFVVPAAILDTRLILGVIAAVIAWPPLVYVIIRQGEKQSTVNSEVGWNDVEAEMERRTGGN
ncbi:MAG: hypothetical protein ACFFD6_03230 [Candidatus Thorarchaeota archaeon]